MMRSLFSGISGLRNHQTRMDVIGNNIANVNTAGYKTARVIFQDIFSQNLSAGMANQGEMGGTNPMQVGLGIRLSTVDVIHTRAAFQRTDKETDMMINGDGFFIVSQINPDTQQFETFYTRAGNFDIDNEGFLVTSQGFYVMGRTFELTTGVVDPGNQAVLGRAMIPAGRFHPGDEGRPLEAVAAETVLEWVARQSELPIPADLSDPANAAQVTALRNWFNAAPPAGLGGNLTIPVGGSYAPVEGDPREAFPARAVNIGDWGAFVAMQGTSFPAVPAETVLDWLTAHTGRPGHPNPINLGDTAQVTALRDWFNDPGGLGGSLTIPAGASSFVPGAGDPRAAFSSAERNFSDWDAFYAELVARTELRGTIPQTEVARERNIQIRPALPATRAGVVEPAPLPRGIFRVGDQIPGGTFVGHPAAVVITEANIDQWNVPAPGDMPVFVAGQSWPATATPAVTAVPFRPPVFGLVASEEPADGGQLTRIRATSERVRLPIDPVTGVTTGVPPRLADETDEAYTARLNDWVNDMELIHGTEEVGLPGMAVADNGDISVIVGNRKLVIGRLALAMFSNPAGLEAAGNSLFRQTDSSGNVVITEAFLDGAGKIEGGGLEMSNVDLANEFTDMIVTQRGFQANSRIVTVTDTMLEELVNLKR